MQLILDFSALMQSCKDYIKCIFICGIHVYLIKQRDVKCPSRGINKLNFLLHRHGTFYQQFNVLRVVHHFDISQ